MSTPASKRGPAAASVLGGLDGIGFGPAGQASGRGRHENLGVDRIGAERVGERQELLLVSDGIGLQREVGFALVPENVGHPIVRDEILDEGDHRRVERPALRPLRDSGAADCDGGEDHPVESVGGDEVVRHQRPVLSGKTVRAKKRRSRHVTAAADEIENTVGMAGLMPLRAAVRGIGLSGDEQHGRPWRLFRAWDLDFAGVFHEAPRRVRAREAAPLT